MGLRAGAEGARRWGSVGASAAFAAIGVGVGAGALIGLGVGGRGVARGVGLGVRRGVGAGLFLGWTNAAVAAGAVPADDPSCSVESGVDTSDGLGTAEGAPVIAEKSADDIGAGVPVADSTPPWSPRETRASPIPRTAIATTATATAPASRRWSASALAGAPPGPGRPVRWAVTGRTGTVRGTAPDWAGGLAGWRPRET